MSKLIAMLVGSCLSLAFIPPAVAEDETPAIVSTDAAQSTEVAPVADTAKAAEAAKTAEVEKADDDEDPVVCKNVAVTGSRVLKGRVCKPQSVWDRREKAAKDLMKSVERGNSTGVGGQTLPGG